MTDNAALASALRRKAHYFKRFHGEGMNETEILLTQAADAIEASSTARGLLRAVSERIREKATHGKGGYPDLQTLAVAEAIDEVLS